jgi:hypothetical protein
MRVETCRMRVEPGKHYATRAKMQWRELHGISGSFGNIRVWFACL